MRELNYWRWIEDLKESPRQKPGPKLSPAPCNRLTENSEKEEDKEVAQAFKTEYVELALVKAPRQQFGARVMVDSVRQRRQGFYGRFNPEMASG